VGLTVKVTDRYLVPPATEASNETPKAELNNMRTSARKTPHKKLPEPALKAPVKKKPAKEKK
jgi:hypothetical protein